MEKLGKKDKVQKASLSNLKLMILPLEAMWLGSLRISEVILEFTGGQRRHEIINVVVVGVGKVGFKYGLSIYYKSTTAAEA